MLEVKDLHTYYGRSHVIQGVSLTVGEGEVVCLLGRNGAGKTTTLRSIMGLTRPRAGHITFRGVEIQGQPPFRICRLGMGYVDQERRIFPDLTVYENLRVVQAQSPEDGWTVEAIYDLFPELVPLQDRKGKFLSGGEQQILAIARSMMVNPRLLLLDEPSQGLAPLIVRRLGDLIGQISRRGVAVLLAEQNVRFALSLASRGYIIDKGQVRHEGDVTALQADEEVLGRYLAV